MANDLAGNGTLGTFTPDPELFAGEMPIITSQGLMKAGTNFAKYTVLAEVAGKMVPYDPAGSDGSEVAVAVLAQPINTSNAGANALNADTMAPIYTGAYFNHRALVWPAAADTLAERIAAFGRTNTIKIGTVL